MDLISTAPLSHDAEDVEQEDGTAARQVMLLDESAFGVFPDELLMNILGHLDIQDLMACTLPYKRMGRMSEEILQQSAFHYLKEALQTDRSRNFTRFLWTERETDRVFTNQEMILPQNTLFMKRLHNILKDGYPLEVLKYLAYTNLFYYNKLNPTLRSLFTGNSEFEMLSKDREICQIFISHAPQLFPLEMCLKEMDFYGENWSDRDELGFSLVIPSFHTMQSLEDRFSLIAKNKTKLFGAAETTGEVISILTRLLELSPERFETVLTHAHLFFTSTLFSDAGAQIVGLLNHISEERLELLLKYAGSFFNEKMDGKDIAACLSTISSETDEFAKWILENADLIFSQGDTFINRGDIVSLLSNTTLGQRNALIENVKNIFDSRADDYDRAGLLKVLMSGTEEKIRLVSTNVLSLFWYGSIYDGFDKEYGLITALYRCTEEQIKSLAINANFFFSDFGNDKIRANMLRELLAGNESQINAIIENANALFSCNMEAPARILKIQELLKMTPEQITLAAKAWNTLPTRAQNQLVRFETWLHGGTSRSAPRQTGLAALLDKFRGRNGSLFNEN